MFGQDEDAVLVADPERTSSTGTDERRDHVINFFDDLPQVPEPPEDEPSEMSMPEWFGPPQQVMGVILSLGQTVLRTEHVFVGLRSVTVYHNGISLDMVLSIRRGEMTRQDWARVEGAIWGHQFPPGMGTTEPSVLRWGVELADGQRAATSERVDWRPDVVPQPPVLVSMDGWSTSGSHSIDGSASLWLWPMPAGESLSLVVQWPALEVAATTHRVDLGPVHAVVEQIQPYWP